MNERGKQRYVTVRESSESQEAKAPTQGGLALADEGRRDRTTPTEDLYSEYTVYDMHYERIGKIDALFVEENDQPQ